MSHLRTPWRAIAAMFIFNGLLYGIWASRIPAIKEQFDLDATTLGMQLLFLSLGAIIALPLTGGWVDRIGAVRVTRITAAVYGFTLAVLAFAPGFWSLAILLFLFGAVHGAFDVAMNAWAAEVEQTADKPIMSSFHAMWSLGAAIGAASGFAAVSAGMSVQQHFVISAVLTAIVCIYFANIKWVSSVEDRTVAKRRFVLPKGILVLVGITALCTTLGEGAMADWSAVFMIEVSKVSEAQAVFGYFAFCGAMVFMRLIGDRVVATFGPVWVARISGVLAVIGSLLAVLIGTFWVVLIGFVLMAFGYALIMPLAISRAASDPTVRPGVAIASVATFAYGGTLLGPPLIGFIAGATSLQFGFLVLSVLAALLVALAGVFARP